MGATCVIGLDFGTSSARALLVRASDGAEIASAMCAYRGGQSGVLTNDEDANVARQEPAEYRRAAIELLGEVMRAADGRVSAGDVRAIGVDATASTPIPVDDRLVPLAEKAEFAHELAAKAWLWKDHTSHAEATRITDTLRAAVPAWLQRCGETYSSEWFWSKVLHCHEVCPRVAGAAATWVEQSDWIPAMLAGIEEVSLLPRNICAAGHKALWAKDLGGLPPIAVLQSLHEGLARVHASFGLGCVSVGTPIGTLSPGFAEQCGLSPETVIASGGIDAHMGALGAGIEPGAMVKIMGTSTCDILLAPSTQTMDIPGLCGIVHDSVVPGALGIEAGQSAVGDLFDWAARLFGSGADAAQAHAKLASEAAELSPGESGLLALDWNNGNRCVLVDPRLTGLLLGQTLHTTVGEIYRALIEATAMGARVILDRLSERGIAVRSIIACGGIAERSPLTMQIYADILKRPVHIARSQQTCALGAAIGAAVAGGAHPGFEDAIRAMTRPSKQVYEPGDEAGKVYDALFELYRKAHDAFGIRGSQSELSDIMKRLIDIRERTSAAHTPGVGVKR